MSFKELDIKISYISYGDDNIADALINPTLKKTKHYKRSVGFFSSSVFETIFTGIVSLVRNGGSIQLICSPKLSEADIEAINLGYKQKEKIINDSFAKDFFDEIQALNDANLSLLSELIARSFLDIKIAVTNGCGDYHDKLAIMEDFEGNHIVFYGSANSSINGYKNNYEKVRVVRSWIPGEKESVLDEIKEFENLWKGENEFVTVYEFKESAQKQILQVIEKRKNIRNEEVITLRDYQNEAIKAWIDNNYRGFYVMATGTGKTWTAIYSAKKLFEKHPALMVICAPYKHLLKQWSEDIEKIFTKAKIIMISSENPNWEEELTQEIIKSRYNNNQIIAISTIKSFNSDRFDKTIQKFKGERLLIVDEAHRLTTRPEYLKERYLYMLGLSATPYSGKSTVIGDELMKFFGGKVYNLPIEIALEKGFLVPYNYYPIIVNATEDEEYKFKEISRRIASCFANGVCIDKDALIRHTRNRLRLISMAQEKIDRIDEIINKVNEKENVVVYCGDGRLFDNNMQKELRHIQFIKSVLDKHGYKPSQFTASENMEKRMMLVDAFNKKEITALAAIRCLDEGINIPSIKSALIFSSNDDYRERNGR